MPGGPPATRSRPDLLGDAEPGAAGARVAHRLGVSRHQRPTRDDAQTRAVPADAGGEVGRTDAIARFPGHELLRGTVFERVERDDREPATGNEHTHRGLEAACQIAELVVHGHPEGLEDARRRVGPAWPAGLHSRDEAAEFVRGRERTTGAPAHDRSSEAGGLGLLAEIGEDPPEVALVPGVHDVARRELEPRFRWIGAHVEGAGRMEAEATGLVGELDRREAEVEEDAVDADEVVLAGQVVEKREVGVDECGAITEARQLPSRDRKSRRVAVEPEKPAIRRGPVEEGGCVSPTADRAVEEAATFAWSKLGEYLGQENRLMSPPIARSRGPRGCR